MTDDLEAYVRAALDPVTIGRYLSCLQLHDVLDPRALALDVGCFVGYFTRLIPIPAIGIDNDPRYIDYARAHALTHWTHYEVMDAEHIAYPDDQFSIAYIMEMLEHHPRPEAVMAEVRRVVAPDRSIIVSTPAPGKAKQIDPDHIMDFDEEWFRFRFFVTRVYRVGTDEYPYHIYKIRNIKGGGDARPAQPETA